MHLAQWAIKHKHLLPYLLYICTKLSQVVLLCRNCMLDVYTNTKYNCPLLFPPLVPPLLNDCCSTVLANGCVAHIGIGQWWNPLVACLDWIPCEVTPRYHCYSKHHTLPQALAHVWDFTIRRDMMKADANCF